MTDVENKGGRNGAYGPDYFQVDHPGRLAAADPGNHASKRSSTCST